MRPAVPGGASSFPRQLLSLWTATRSLSSAGDKGRHDDDKGPSWVPRAPAATTSASSSAPPSSLPSDAAPARRDGPRTAWMPAQDAQKTKLDDLRKDNAHDRLSSLFERHQTRARQHAQPGTETSAHAHAFASGTRATIFSGLDATFDDVEEADVKETGAAWESEAMSPRRDRFTVDEDAMGGADGGRPARASAPVPRRQPTHAAASMRAPATPSTTTLDTLEQELLDDAFHYFAPVPLSTSTTTPALTDSRSTTARAKDAEATSMTMPEVTYVPGQQIIPPGFTRYRVDVQYQGADFDGWYKSSTRRLVRRHVHADGTVQTVPLSADEEKAVREGTTSAGGGNGGGGGVQEDGISTLYHAKTVLEDALAVAMDVPSVSVVASVMPEVGVSVRRLPCHVDIPSDVEMQPRTILQRATLWLQQRNQPLAILSCHRCRNQDFHARHGHGVRRVYCYRMLNRVAPPLFDAGFQWHVDRHLDVARMQRFAQAMEGTHDYGYFADPKMANALRRAAASGASAGFATRAMMDEHEEPLSHGLGPGQIPAAPKVHVEKGLGHLERAAAMPTFNEYGQTVLSFDAKPRQYFKAATNLPTVRTIDKIHVVRQEDEVLVWFVGQSFLRHQIRHMVSVLKASGHGLWDELELQSAFQGGFEVSRKKFQRERLPPAPVCGLTLWDVEYPREFQDDYVPFVDSGPYEEVDISSIH